jgi:hypothetical protein
MLLAWRLARLTLVVKYDAGVWKAGGINHRDAEAQRKKHREGNWIEFSWFLCVLGSVPLRLCG